MSGEPDEAYAKRINYERAGWRQLRETYRRCVLIAEEEWRERLDKAQEEQQQLAEDMRDRAVSIQTQIDASVGGKADQFRVKGEPADRSPVFVPGPVHVETREIVVPLFTPRDRVQFIKEAAVTLLIEAGRRQLAATPEAAKEPEALTEENASAILAS